MAFARGVIRSFKHLNGTRLRNPSEAHPKLAIVITDEVLRPHTKGASFPKRFGGPSVGGISCLAICLFRHSESGETVFLEYPSNSRRLHRRSHRA